MLNKAGAQDVVTPLIVVGVDGSELSIEALRWAARHAHHENGRLRVIVGYDVPWTIFFAATTTEADYERAAEEVLARSIAEALGDEPGLEVESRVVMDRPAHALTGAAQGASLLVVGSHGRGELPGMHLGSVAGYCVHHAPCPVLVFRTEHTGR